MIRGRFAWLAVNTDDVASAGKRRTDEYTTEFTATARYCYSHQVVCLCCGLVNGFAAKVPR